jgi:hypothetical protein
MDRTLRPALAISRPQGWRSHLALVVVAGVTVALALALPRNGTIPAVTDLSTHRLPALGIEFDYPANWHLQEFGEEIGMTSLTGALVSNVDHDFEHPDLGPSEGTSAWEMRGLPEGLILISFEQLDRHNFEAKRTKGLPLRLDDAVVYRDAGEGIDTFGAPQPRYFLPFAVEGHLNSGIQVYIGDVDGDERAVVDRILASVRER